MRNANLEDQRKLHERGEFYTNVMFQNYRGDKFHTKKLNRYTHIYGDLYAAQQILVESADTNELTVSHRSNLFAIKRGNSEQSKKAPRTKPHVKGTRPEKLVPYDSKLMDKPRWVKLRDGRRTYTWSHKYFTDLCVCSYTGAVSFDGRAHLRGDADNDIVGVYLPYEEWNSVESTPSDGWINGSDVPKDGNSYFVKWHGKDIYVATWSEHLKWYIIGGAIHSGPMTVVTAYKPIEHEGLYKYGH